MDKEKKVAFITGAAGGLGTAVVEKLLDKNFIVLVNDNNQENVQRLLDKFNGDDIQAFCFDGTLEENDGCECVKYFLRNKNDVAITERRQQYY